MLPLKQIILFLSTCLIISGCATVKSVSKLPAPPEGFKPLEAGAAGKGKMSDYAKGRMKVFDAEDISKLQGATVFLGDSLTERFKFKQYFLRLFAANRGVGGDCMGGTKVFGLYDRLTSSVYPLHPKRIVLLVGVNDIVWVHDLNLQQKTEQYAYLVWKLRHDLPKAELWCVSTLPTGGKWGSVNKDIVDFNHAARNTAEKYGAKYVDIHDLYLDAKNEIRPELTNDGIHLSPAGYDIMAEAYKKHIFKK